MVSSSAKIGSAEPDAIVGRWRRIFAAADEAPLGGLSWRVMVEAARIELASGNTTQSGLHA